MPGFQTYGNNAIYVDASQLTDKLTRMRDALGEENFRKLMVRTFRRTASKAATIISQDVRKEYPVKDGWVRGAIKTPKVTTGGEYIAGCTIPMSGVKGLEGPNQTFKLDNRGRSARLKPILVKKGGRKPLPMRLKNQGNNPPFLANGRHGVGLMVMTRRTKFRHPIVRVGGLSLPQMPMNRSENQISEDLIKFTQARLDHEFDYMMRNL